MQDFVDKESVLARLSQIETKEFWSNIINEI